MHGIHYVVRSGLSFIGERHEIQLAMVRDGRAIAVHGSLAAAEAHIKALSRAMWNNFILHDLDAYFQDESDLEPFNRERGYRGASNDKLYAEPRSDQALKRYMAKINLQLFVVQEVEPSSELYVYYNPYIKSYVTHSCDVDNRLVMSRSAVIGDIMEIHHACNGRLVGSYADLSIFPQELEALVERCAWLDYVQDPKTGDFAIVVAIDYDMSSSSALTLHDFERLNTLLRMPLIEVKAVRYPELCEIQAQLTRCACNSNFSSIRLVGFEPCSAISA